MTSTIFLCILSYLTFVFTSLLVVCCVLRVLCFFNYTATTEIYTYCHTLSLHDALPISPGTNPAAPKPHPTASLYVGDLNKFVFSPLLATLVRSEEHTSELQSLMRISYAVFCLKKKNVNRQ